MFLVKISSDPFLNQLPLIEIKIYSNHDQLYLFKKSKKYCGTADIIRTQAESTNYPDNIKRNSQLHEKNHVP